MLTFDLRSIEGKAATVDSQLLADDPVWQNGDPRPETAVTVKGRLSAAGSGRFYWHGHIAGDVLGDCRRCLADARAHIYDETHIIFAEPSELTDDDPDIYPLEAGARELDLRPAIREEWLLAQPQYLLCREDCKGMCPRCGADLNEGPCDCPPQADSRWDSLRKVEKG